MPSRFIVRPLAEANLEDASRWYNDERAGLAGRFLREVDRTFARIRERSVASPVASGFSRKAVAVVNLGSLHASFRLKPEATLD